MSEKTKNDEESVEFDALIKVIGRKGKHQSRGINVTQWTRPEDVKTVIKVKLTFPRERISTIQYDNMQLESCIKGVGKVIKQKKYLVFQEAVLSEGRSDLFTTQNYRIYEHLIEALRIHKNIVDEQLNKMINQRDQVWKKITYNLDSEMKCEQGIIDLNLWKFGIDDNKYKEDTEMKLAINRQGVKNMGMDVFKEKYNSLRKSYLKINKEIEKLKAEKENKKNQSIKEAEEKYGEVPAFILKLVEFDVANGITAQVIEDHTAEYLMRRKGGRNRWK